MKTTISLFLAVVLFSCSKQDDRVGNTEIAKWLNGKSAAISITLDDASINQFRQAMPIMDTLGLKATFFIIMEEVKQSANEPKFLGRAPEEIIKETATKPTNSENLFERASLLRFTGIKDAVELHNNAGSTFEEGKPEEAYKIVDEAFQKVRSEKAFQRRPKNPDRNRITWEEVKKYAANGHEFGSHTLSHPRLSVLDEQNMLYELQKSKDELMSQLGALHTFSAECPFGTENERVMSYAHKIYPALRNRMPEAFLTELNRSSKEYPGAQKNEYIQWQRGPLKETTLDQMKSFVDTLLVHDNVWLVLTFHGVDGIGWQAKPHEELAAYFKYMNERKDKLWIDTFGNVTRYMRERMNAKVNVREKGEKIVLSLEHSLDKEMYRIPLTLKTFVSPLWKMAHVQQGKQEQKLSTTTDETGTFVLFPALPNGDDIILTAQ